MNQEQKELYDSLVLTSTAVADALLKSDTSNLSPIELDEVVYQAIIEKWHDDLF